MYKYLEIVKDDTNEVVSRMDVTDKSERQIDKIWDGASINLNHDDYSLQLNECETKFDKI